MNGDLEATLDELGPEYRAVVARLRGARELQEIGRPVFRLRSEVLRPVLAAASLLVFAGLGVVFLGRKDFRRETSDAVGYGPREYRLTVAEMVASQNADGSWANDFLTRHNAEVLRQSADPAARIAYKKALRNLRSRGVL